MSFKIYTKTGDQGQTGLFGGARVSKDHLRIEAYGTLDELNAFLGLLRDHCSLTAQREILYEVQNRLFSIGGMLATDPSKDNLYAQTLDLYPADLAVLEQAIDALDAQLPPLKNFILPGGHPTVSYAHLARCVCRRAERCLVSLHAQEAVDPLMLSYLNRLSDYLFVLGRALAQDLGVEEVIWKKR
jgi:cob(I)alamin adenosyltransferase